MKHLEMKNLWKLWQKGVRKANTDCEYYKAEYFDEFLVEMEEVLTEIEPETIELD